MLMSFRPVAIELSRREMRLIDILRPAKRKRAVSKDTTTAAQNDFAHWTYARLRSGSQLPFVFVISFCLFHPSLTQAATLTFEFDAEIVNVPVGNPFTLPLTYQVGDTIHGTFTFDPNLGSAVDSNTIASVQPFAIQFTIGGIAVGSSSHHIEAFNNTTIDDGGFPEPIDVIRIGCSEPLCNPELQNVSSVEPFRVRSQLQLVGNSSVMPAAEIPSDPSVWNAFLLDRKLTVGFDNVGPGSMGFDAVIGNTAIVPEPHILVLICFSGTLGAMFGAPRNFAGTVVRRRP
jgi:hypothetical protein